MSASLSDIPVHAKGEVILNAKLTAAPGRADDLQKYLAAVKKYALSEDEPGCLEYRTTRCFLTGDEVFFAVFERYTGPPALKEHFASPPFQDMIAAEGLMACPPVIEYYYEFS